DSAACPTRCTVSLEVHETWRTASCTAEVVVEDTLAPQLPPPPPDETVACDAVPAPLVVPAADDCDPAPAVTFAEVRTDGSCAGNYTLTRIWTATDRCGNATSETQVVQVVDTTPPVVEGGADVLACLWPPNHKYVCFTLADFSIVATDACSEPVTLRFAG